MRAELRNATDAYTLIWEDSAGNTGPPTEASHAVSRRYAKAAIKVANFEARMADRTNTISQLDIKTAREQNWEAGRKVKFAVEEGMGAGEKPKAKKEKLPAIALGWVAVESPVSLPVREKKDA